MHRKKSLLPLSPTDILDMTLDTEKGKVMGFVLNYRTKIGNKFYPVYRVDNRHGYLHEQKYWLSPTRIPIKIDKPLKIVYDEYSENIKNNWERYKTLYINKQS